MKATYTFLPIVRKQSLEKSKACTDPSRAHRSMLLADASTHSSGMHTSGSLSADQTRLHTSNCSERLSSGGQFVDQAPSQTSNISWDVQPASEASVGGRILSSCQPFDREYDEVRFGLICTYAYSGHALSARIHSSVMLNLRVWKQIPFDREYDGMRHDDVRHDDMRHDDMMLDDVRHDDVRHDGVRLDDVRLDDVSDDVSLCALMYASAQSVA